MRKIYLLLLSLLLLPYMAVAQTDDFNVTGGTSGTDYSYSDGVLTVNSGANITISMASEATEPTSDRIAVTGNAEITLNGVNITAPSYGATTGNAQSAIDVSENAHLILNLSDDKNNTLTGGSGSTDLGAPGIHVPASSSLVIQGSGNLSVTGGNSTNTYGGNGIGGKPATGQPGTTCGTVIILATGSVTISGGSGMDSGTGGIDIGGGKGTQDGTAGQGIRPVSDQENTYTVWGELTLPCDITIPEGATVIIPEGASLNTGSHTLTNNGTIQVNGDTLTGTPEGSGKVQQQLTESMVEIEPTSYTYTGEEIKPVVTIGEYTESEDYEVSYENNTNAGEATITITPTDDGSLFGDAVTVNFTIAQATPTYTVPTGLTATYGETLASVTLPDGWNWQDAETTSVGNAGNNTFKATFTPNDKENYKTVSDIDVTITVNPANATLSFAEKEITVKVNDTYQNTLTTEPGGLAVTYSSSDTEVATVDASSGEVTILAAGTTTITATDNDPNYEAEAASYTLTVEHADLPEGSEIELDKTSETIEFAGEMTTTLTATVTGDLGENPKWEWKSSDEKVATVPEHGDEAVAMLRANNATESSTATITIHKTGEATITATYTDSKYTGEVTFNLTVTEKEEEPAPDPKPDPQPQPDPTPLYYNIQFENICEGVDASLSKGVVKEGNQVSVYIEVEEGYDAENLKVLFKRSLYGYWEEVDEGVQPGEYIIYNVYNDIYVKVEGVEKIEEEPTGMSDIEGTKVYAQDGNLYVYTSQPQEVAIITMNGTVLRRERQEGLRSYSLPKGVYIICIGEERMKVRI